MEKYVLVYRGGSTPEGEAEGQKVMEAWMAWFGALGEAVVDGGSPFGPSSTVKDDGSVTVGGASALTGYSIIAAGNLSEAQDKAKGCPVLSGGGTVEVYEVAPIG
jgi:hypothetical protein